MGSWQWEAIKMVGYIAFPIATFHWFNQPDTFTAWVDDVRATYMTPTPAEDIKRFKEFKEKFNREKDLEALRAMEANLNKN